MFKAPFSFKGRIRRLEYGLSYIIYSVIAGIMQVVIEEEVYYNPDLLVPSLLLFIPLLWFLFAQGAKRCHDRNGSGWWQIVPFYGLWMIFADGTEGPNEYGPNPKNPNQAAMPNTSSGESIIEQLEKYAKMKEAGVLTEEEFSKMKEKLLNSETDPNSKNTDINFE